MEHLWSPWRHKYLVSDKGPEVTCIFCKMAAEENDRQNLIVHRAVTCFVVLNRFPYTSGHLMVVPYQHASDLTQLEEAAAIDLMALTRLSTVLISDLYRPDGLNLGMNLGEAAGAGIAGHLHMHVLPRWRGDANFMTTVGETRVIPEDLHVSWTRFHDAFRLKS